MTDRMKQYRGFKDQSVVDLRTGPERNVPEPSISFIPKLPNSFSQFLMPDDVQLQAV